MPELKFNTPCPGHSHYCWAYRHLMNETDVICNKDYKRVPPEIRTRIYAVLNGVNVSSNKSIVVAWLLENELPYSCSCNRETS